METQSNGLESITTGRSSPLQSVIAWLGRLEYSHDGDWLSLPDWAMFCIELGAALATYRNSKSSVVVALAVPARSYVATLVSAGYIACRALASPADPKDHLLLLKALPAGSTLTLTEGGRKFKATLQAVRCEGGEVKFIEIRTGNRETRFLPPNDAHQIEVLDKQAVRLPEYPQGREADSPTPLVKSLLKESKADIFMRVTLTNCLVIGRRNRLKYELLETRLGYRGAEGGLAKGQLQDVVRAEDVSRTGSGYRSVVLPASSANYKGIERDFSADLIVFDGSHSYYRWGELWKSSDRVIILDRTDHSFEDGRALANQEYGQRATRSSVSLSLSEPPSAIEAMAFEVAR